MNTKQFFHDLFRNKIFLTAYLVLIIIVAIYLGMKYGSNEPTTYKCYDRNNIEQPCPVSMGGTPIINNTNTTIHWSNSS